MNLLHLDSSILGPNSVSRRLSAAIVARLTTQDPALVVTTRDLAADPLDHLTVTSLPAASPADRAVLDQFLATDILVIGAPMYNFTVPSQLKAWIDRILVAGETFHYTATGPEGLASGKRVIVALARGGFYGPDSPTAAAEHLESYLTSIFGFIGITPEFIAADGIATGADGRDAAIQSALAKIEALTA